LRGQKLREVVHEVMKVGLGVVDEADDFAGQAVERRRAARGALETGPFGS